MDLRVLVLTADPELGELVRAQVENLGCRCTVAATYDEGSTALSSWVEAAVVDLARDGIEDLNRLRVEAPFVRVLALAPGAELGAAAEAAGVHAVLVEPFSIADLVEAVRAMGEPNVVDLRRAAPVVAEAPG